jgi:hypothetical protein
MWAVCKSREHKPSLEADSYQTSKYITSFMEHNFH